MFSFSVGCRDRNAKVHRSGCNCGIVTFRNLIGKNKTNSSEALSFFEKQKQQFRSSYSGSCAFLIIVYFFVQFYIKE